MTEQQDFQQPTNIGAHEQELLRKRHRVVPEPHDVAETEENPNTEMRNERKKRSQKR